MIRSWLSRRRAARIEKSKKETRQLKALIEQDLLPHLATHGFSESPFMPEPQGGKLLWDPSNRDWEVQYARITGARCEAIFIRLFPDHQRGSWVSLNYNFLTFDEPPTQPLLPGSYPLRDQRGVLSRAHIRNYINNHEFSGGWNKLSLRKHGPEGVLCNLMQALADPDQIYQSWSSKRSPITLYRDGTSPQDTNG